MKNFYLVGRDATDSCISIIDDISNYISSKGGVCDRYIDEDGYGQFDLTLPDECDVVIVVGGDGTIIRTAASIYKSGVPIIGLNRGHMGYLCDLDDDNLYESLDSIMNDEFSVEDRMMVSGVIKENLIEISPNISALNDIVIKSTSQFSIMRVVVYVNDTYLYAYDCDGIIFSTPTGSTAYNMSANGPIVNPQTSVILVTPINPHTLNARSIVLDPMDEVSIEIEKRFESDEIPAEVNFDGNKTFPLNFGQRLYVTKSKSTTKMIHLKDVSFLDRIGIKMQVNY